MRVAQRASGGGAGSSLLSLGLPGAAWAGWATAASWAWSGKEKVEGKMEMAAWATGLDSSWAKTGERGEVSWAWLLLSAWAEMREGGRASWAGLRKKGKRIFPFNHL